MLTCLFATASFCLRHCVVLSVCLSVCLSSCLSVFLSVCLSRGLSVGFSSVYLLELDLIRSNSRSTSLIGGLTRTGSGARPGTQKLPRPQVSCVFLFPCHGRISNIHLHILSGCRTCHSLPRVVAYCCCRQLASATCNRCKSNRSTL